MSLFENSGKLVSLIRTSSGDSHSQIYCTDAVKKVEWLTANHWDWVFRRQIGLLIWFLFQIHTIITTILLDKTAHLDRKRGCIVFMFCLCMEKETHSNNCIVMFLSICSLMQVNWIGAVKMLDMVVSFCIVFVLFCFRCFGCTEIWIEWTDCLNTLYPRHGFIGIR